VLVAMMNFFLYILCSTESLNRLLASQMTELSVRSQVDARASERTTAWATAGRRPVSFRFLARPARAESFASPERTRDAAVCTTKPEAEGESSFRPRSLSSWLMLTFLLLKFTQQQ